eukprot:SAG31_NODE_9113_length_1331_cov_2.284091_1_plen_158_part_01
MERAATRATRAATRVAAHVQAVFMVNCSQTYIEQMIQAAIGKRGCTGPANVGGTFKRMHREPFEVERMALKLPSKTELVHCTEEAQMRKKKKKTTTKKKEQHEELKLVVHRTETYGGAMVALVVLWNLCFMTTVASATFDAQDPSSHHRGLQSSADPC